MSNATFQQVIDAQQLYGEVFYIQPEELAGYKEMPSELYIRGNTSAIAEELIIKKQSELVFESDDPAVPSVVKITEPLTFFFYPTEDGSQGTFLQDGNTRRRAYTLLMNDQRYAGYRFEPIPVRQLLIDNVTKDTILKLQLNSNDTTLSHTPMQLAQAAIEYYEDKLADIQQECEKTGEEYSQRKAQKRASEATKLMFGFSDATLSNARQAVQKLPDWAQEQINAGVISLSNMVDLLRSAEKCQIPLITLFQSCMTQKSAEETTISPKLIKKVIKQFEKDIPDTEGTEGSEGAENEGDSDSSEGSEASETGKNKLDGFDSVKAKNLIEEAVLLASEIEVTPEVVAAHEKLAIGTVAATAAALQRLVDARSKTVMCIPVTKLQEVQRRLMNTIDYLLGDEVKLLEGVGIEEMFAIQQAFLALNKQTGSLYEQLNSEALAEESEAINENTIQEDDEELTEA